MFCISWGSISRYGTLFIILVLLGNVFTMKMVTNEAVILDVEYF